MMIDSPMPNEDQSAEREQLLEAALMRWDVYRHVPNTREVLFIKARACAQEMVYNYATFARAIRNGFDLPGIGPVTDDVAETAALELPALQMRSVSLAAHNLLPREIADRFFWDVVDEFAISATAHQGSKGAFEALRVQFTGLCKDRLAEYCEIDQLPRDDGKNFGPPAYAAARHVFDYLSSGESFDALLAFPTLQALSVSLHPAGLLDPGDIWQPFSDSTG